MKFPCELHQNLQYFWIMKTHVVNTNFFSNESLDLCLPSTGHLLGKI